MCGIAGVFNAPFPLDYQQSFLRKMIGMIDYRGPDGIQVWLDPQGKCGLAHARLSIIDLEGGRQPISNEDDSIFVVFNGEIYNYPELKTELLKKGHLFKTQSDTEVLVHLFEEEGVAMANRLRGMFSIAIWDRRHQSLHLIRDHIGKKPLHYWRDGNGLYFSSEYKSFLCLKNFKPQMDVESLHYLLNLRWIPSGKTLMQDVEQVLPGEVVTFNGENVTKERYWTPKVLPESNLSEEEHAENIRELLSQSVSRRLVSDVPVGLFLSGGLDSSAILALMAREEMKYPIQSFSLGFGNANDETGEAEETANYFGALHTNFYVDQNPLRYFEKSIWHSEIPKVNAVQLYALAKQVDHKVKVVMTGLGGDELFGGYDNYQFIRYAGKLADIPLPGLGDSLRKIIFNAMGSGNHLELDQIRRGLEMGVSFGRRSHFYSILRNTWDVDDGMFSQIYSPEFAQSQKKYRTSDIFIPYLGDNKDDFLAKTMACELSEKLVSDQILVEDRNLMAHGIEGRAPFLDVDLIEYAAQIPTSMKINWRQGRKHILRKALEPILPEFVFTRSKKGFAFDPVQQFTRDLRPLAEEVLTKKNVEKLGIFNYSYIRRLLDSPPSEKLHWHYWLLWTMIGITSWNKQFIETKHN